MVRQPRTSSFRRPTQDKMGKEAQAEVAADLILRFTPDLDGKSVKDIRESTTNASA